MRLQIVTWRDAYFDLEEPGSPRKDYLVKTVGWTKKKGRWLVVHSEKLPDGGWRAISRVPLENVVERRDLT